MQHHSSSDMAPARGADDALAPPPFVAFDPLTEVLNEVRLRSFVTPQCEFSAPFGVSFPQGPPGFHVVMSGSCVLTMEGERVHTELHAGDLVVLPHGTAHRLRDDARTPTVPIQRLVTPQHMHGRIGLRVGGGGVRTELVSGMFLFDDADQSPLLQALPTLLHLSGRNGATEPWLKETLGMIERELKQHDPGAATVVNQLAQVLFVQAVRAHAAGLEDEQTGWLRAVTDAQIGPALGAIHAEPEKPWTVESLAAHVAMSRSSFSARFTQRVGEPPLKYLTSCRMRRACLMLRQGKAGLKEIAAKSGYDSEFAFSNAFKRHTGIAPGVYRRMSSAEALPNVMV